LTAGCTTFVFPPPDKSSPPPAQDNVYDVLNPYWVEICAMSRLKPVDGKKGGSGGHAALYLQGVCRQKDTAYPSVGMCPRYPEDAADLGEEDSGVGISADKMFKNVNWVAVPGRSFFFSGGLQPAEEADQRRKQEVSERAIQTGIFRGILLKDRFCRDKVPGQSDEAFLADKAIGTDYAIDFGRAMLCVKIPVTRPMIEKMAAYLNEVNAFYFAEGREYRWNVWNNNCAHTVHNTLAAAGIGSRKKTGFFIKPPFMNLAVPATEFARLAFLSEEESIEDYRRIKNDDQWRQLLETEKWLPMRHGVLLRQSQIRTNRQLFDRNAEVLVTEMPLWRGKTRKIERMFREPRFTDLRANLEYFRDFYAGLLAEIRKERVSGKAKDSASGFRQRYEDYVRASFDDVRDQLKRLAPSEREMPEKTRQERVKSADT
jgi:hypothetical protein